MSVRIRVLWAFLCALGLLALTVGAIYASQQVSLA